MPKYSETIGGASVCFRKAAAGTEKVCVYSRGNLKTKVFFFWYCAGAVCIPVLLSNRSIIQAPEILSSHTKVLSIPSGLFYDDACHSWPMCYTLFIDSKRQEMTREDTISLIIEIMKNHGIEHEDQFLEFCEELQTMSQAELSEQLAILEDLAQ